MENVKYWQLMRLLAESSIDYRVINHNSEGHTARASELRGHAPHSAAKCMLVSARTGADDRHVLAVLPGDRRVDYRKVKALCGGDDVRMADRSAAEELTGCVSGCIIPLSLGGNFSVIFDSALLDSDEVYFNAARLDRSIGVNPYDLVALERPRLGDISKANDRGSSPARPSLVCRSAADSTGAGS